MTKSLDERIAEVEEKTAQYENQIKRLLQQRKEQKRKVRTRRLIERGALLESMIDGADLLTNEQIKAILTAALHSEPAIAALISTHEQQGPAQSKEAKTTPGTGA